MCFTVPSSYVHTSELYSHSLCLTLVSFLPQRTPLYLYLLTYKACESIWTWITHLNFCLHVRGNMKTWLPNAVLFILNNVDFSCSCTSNKCNVREILKNIRNEIMWSKTQLPVFFHFYVSNRRFIFFTAKIFIVYANVSNENFTEFILHKTKKPFISMSSA